MMILRQVIKFSEEFYPRYRVQQDGLKQSLETILFSVKFSKSLILIYTKALLAV